MKKNRMMRLASVLLVLVLLSTSVISGTFAKYTTEDSGTDSARVAYWGFGLDTDLDFTIFADNYNSTVQSRNTDGEGGDDKVVAPGTFKNDTFKFAYTNYGSDKITAPEVNYSITVTPSITGDVAVFDDNPNFIWTLDGAYYKTSTDLLTALKGLSGDPTDGTQEYEYGNLPDAFNTTSSHTIGWEWLFEEGDQSTATSPVDGSKLTAENNDEDDTVLGNKSTLDDITISISIEITQLD